MKLYYGKTPNGMKPILFFTEHKVPFEAQGIDIFEGEQFQDWFLKISPNNKIPALTDGDLNLFESGVILEYLADKHLDFKGDSNRYEILKWLYWQVGGLGPMLGQNHHFNRYAPEKVPYAIERYEKESQRLYSVLDKNLAENKFVGSDQYHIADMAIYPWTKYYKEQNIDIDNYKNVKRWMKSLDERESVKEAYAEYFDK